MSLPILQKRRLSLRSDLLKVMAGKQRITFLAPGAEGGSQVESWRLGPGKEGT